MKGDGMDTLIRFIDLAVALLPLFYIIYDRHNDKKSNKRSKRKRNLR
jgi:hypothetical protein